MIHIADTNNSGTIDDLMELAFILMKSKRKAEKFPTYRCGITKSQVRWLASMAFHTVLSRKQSSYLEVLAWLDRTSAETRPRAAADLRRLQKVLQAADKAFAGHRY